MQLACSTRLNCLNSKISQLDNAEADLVSATRGKPSSSNDQQVVIIFTERHQAPRVRIGLRRSVLDPRSISTKVLVHKNGRLASSADNDAAVGSANLAPDDGGRAHGTGALIGDERVTWCAEDVEGIR